MKRKLFIVLAAATMVTLLATSGAYALFRETDIVYFYEDGLLMQSGEYDIDCDGNVSQWGNVNDSYRVYDQYSCSTGQRVVHKCQETDGMGGWITFTCPAHLP